MVRAIACIHKGAILGVAFEYSEAMANPNPKLTEDEVNSVPLFGAFPRRRWRPCRPSGRSGCPLCQLKRKKCVFFGALMFTPTLCPRARNSTSGVDELKASFHAINDEDKPITAAIARNAAALSAQPGRLSPKEQTIWEFQRYLARMLVPVPAPASKAAE